ncbi:MAG: FdtA/QdtA family cupin domain-containing protein [Saprospiraceae bacterium]|jgi:dTDP-4-dehydrorhamnose 3,5-epimerase-like enzyme|nr:FdtA/QdtA family cupin domain-containing protein [Saprospiraceae bacterium]
MSNAVKPHVINFPAFGNPAEGYIAVNQYAQALPFEVKRTFWTYHTPEAVTRGRHAHHNTQMVLIAAAGKIIVDLEEADGTVSQHVLESPTVGLYIPAMTWHVMKYSHNAIQIVFASSDYDESDYIREYQVFQSLINSKD